MTKFKGLSLSDPWEVINNVRINSENFKVTKVYFEPKFTGGKVTITVTNKDDERDYAVLDLHDFSNRLTYFNNQELDGYVPRKEEPKPQKFVSYKVVVKVGDQYISKFDNDGNVKFTGDKSQALPFDPEIVRVYGYDDVVSEFGNYNRARRIARSLGGKVIKHKIVKLIYPDEEE